MLLGQFLNSPTSELDTSCVNQIAPLDFQDEYGIGQQIFGDWDAWGDETYDASPAPFVPPAPSIEQLRRKLRTKGTFAH